MIEKLTITGKSGHSSNPALGNNAMESMQRILGQLMAMRDRMKEQKHAGFLIDHPTLNLGCIQGGDNANRICGHCFLAFEIRPLPGMDLNQLQKDLERQIADTAEADKMDWTLEKLIVPPFCGDEHSEIVALCEKLTGHARGIRGLCHRGTLPCSSWEWMWWCWVLGTLMWLISRMNFCRWIACNQQLIFYLNLLATVAYNRAMTANNYVQFFRETSPYIHAHRGKTFVIALSGDAV